MRHGTCFRRRVDTHHAGAAPHSAVAEVGLVRRITCDAIVYSFCCSSRELPCVSQPPLRSRLIKIGYGRLTAHAVDIQRVTWCFTSVLRLTAFGSGGEFVSGFLSERLLATFCPMNFAQRRSESSLSLFG